MVIITILHDFILQSMYTKEKWAHWDIGYFSIVGDFVGGRFLLVSLQYFFAITCIIQIWMTIAAMICNLGLFNASMMTCSRGIAYMAKNGMLPWFLGYQSCFGTPWVAVLFNAIITSILIMVPFQVLVGIEIVINSVSIIMLFVAWTWLYV